MVNFSRVENNNENNFHLEFVNSSQHLEDHGDYGVGMGFIDNGLMGASTGQSPFIISTHTSARGAAFSNAMDTSNVAISIAMNGSKNIGLNSLPKSDVPLFLSAPLPISTGYTYTTLHSLEMSENVVATSGDGSVVAFSNQTDPLVVLNSSNAWYPVPIGDGGPTPIAISANGTRLLYSDTFTGFALTIDYNLGSWDTATLKNVDEISAPIDLALSSDGNWACLLGSYGAFFYNYHNGSWNFSTSLSIIEPYSVSFTTGALQVAIGTGMGVQIYDHFTLDSTWASNSFSITTYLQTTATISGDGTLIATGIDEVGSNVYRFNGTSWNSELFVETPFNKSTLSVDGTTFAVGTGDFARVFKYTSGTWSNIFTPDIGTNKLKKFSLSSTGSVLAIADNTSHIYAISDSQTAGNAFQINDTFAVSSNGQLVISTPQVLASYSLLNSLGKSLYRVTSSSDGSVFAFCSGVGGATVVNSSNNWGQVSIGEDVNFVSLSDSGTRLIYYDGGSSATVSIDYSGGVWDTGTILSVNTEIRPASIALSSDGQWAGIVDGLSSTISFFNYYVDTWIGAGSITIISAHSISFTAGANQVAIGNDGGVAIYDHVGESWISTSSIISSKCTAVISSDGKVIETNYDLGGTNVYRFNGTSWINELVIDTPFDYASLSRDGSVVVSSDKSSTVNIYKYTNGTWTNIFVPGIGVNNAFGFALSASGTVLAVPDTTSSIYSVVYPTRQTGNAIKVDNTFTVSRDGFIFSANSLMTTNVFASNISASGSFGSSGQVLSQTGTGIAWASPSALVIAVTPVTSGTYQILASDYYIGCDGSGITIVLPLGSTISTGKQYIIKDESGNALLNNVTISGNGSLIDGNSTIKLYTNYMSLTLLWTGSRWSII
jgi:hypothetical protein